MGTRTLLRTPTGRQRRLGGLLGAALGVLVVSVAAPARAACRVPGERLELEDVMVRPAGAEPFTLSLYGVQASVTVGARSSTPARVEVERPFAFSGVRRGVWFFIATAQRTDAIHIAPGALLRQPRSLGSDVIGSLLLDTGGVPVSGPQEPAEFVHDVRVPCAALSLDGHFPDQVASADTVGDQTFWQLRGTNLPLLLRQEPRWSAPSVRFGGTRLRDGPPLWFERLGERGGWMKVVRRAARAQIVGWIDKSRLTPLPEAPAEAGCCAEYDGKAHTYHRSSTAALVYQGPAEIAAGAKVYSLPGRGLWATVTEATRVRVQIHVGDTWIHLQRVPGLPGAQAYVSADAVKFEKRAAPP